MLSSTPLTAGHRADSGPTLGIDLGTSAVTALLVDGGRVLATAHAPLAAEHPTTLRAVRAIGAARLAQAALSGCSDFARSHATRVFEPRPALVQRHDAAHVRWPQLYPLVRPTPGAAPALTASDPMP